MSAESSYAVFLSYASQDADAARRICEALRATGIEVWFDQNELVGGDAWDAKIRKQIAECALFVPIISAGTQARDEGYFRLEWKLAVDRSHLMAHDKAFLLPVVIDATPDATARVPPEFKNVQWTRLPSGETSEKFCARVKQLLGGSGMAPERPRPAERGEDAAAPAKPKSSRVWLAPVILGVAAILALAFWQPWKAKEKPTLASATPVMTPAAPPTDARKLVAQALALIDDPDYVRENFRLAEELCTQALALDKTDAEVWAAAARVSQEMTYNAYDRSPQRREQSRTLAERAVRLAPKSLNARLAVARNVSLSGDYAEAVRLLRALLAEAPNDRLVLRELLHAERATENDAGAKEMVARIRALPGGDPVALIYEARDLDNLGRFPEAEAIADQLLAESPIRMAYYTKLLLLARFWSDVSATRDFIQKIPPRLLADDGFAALVAEFWMRAGDSEKALAALARISHEMLQEFATYEPKGLLTGWAFTMAGRPAAAQAEWQRALAAVEQRLVAEPNQTSLLSVKAILQAQLGQKAAAHETWNLLSEFVAAAGAPVNPYATAGGARFAVAMGETEEAILNLVQRWPSMPFATRSSFVSDLRDAPFLAPIRHDPRVEQLINEHTAALETLRHGEKKATAAAPTVNEKSLVVLPLENLSPDPDNAFFTDGMHAEIISTLGQISDLKVISRNSALAFKGSTTSFAEIAQKLGVANVITGSVRRAGDKVRIQLELRRASDEALLWSLPKGDRELKDALAVQTEIADEVARVLQLRVAKGASEVARYSIKDPRAYDFILKAQAAFWAKFNSRVALEETIRLAQESFAIEPSFLSAGWISGSNSMLHEAEKDPARRLALAAEAKRWAEEASRLTPGGIGDTAMVEYLFYVERDFVRAAALGENCVRATPNNSAAWNFYALSLESLGRVAEASDIFRRALSEDPLYGVLWANLIRTLTDLRRAEETRVAVTRLRAITPTDFSENVRNGLYRLFGELPNEADVKKLGSSYQARWLWRAGKFDELLAFIEAELQRNDRADDLKANLLLRRSDAWRKKGDATKAREAAEAALVLLEKTKTAATTNYVSVDTHTINIRMIEALARVGRADEAVAMAQRSVEMAMERSDVRARWDSEIDLAGVLAVTNRPRKCIELLAKLLREPSGLTVPMLKLDSIWDNVRDDPAFKALLADPKNAAPL